MSPDRVVVHGSAMRDVAPDVAVLRAVVVEVDRDRREAFRRCGARAAGVVQGLRAAAGDDGEVTTGDVSLDVYYEERSRHEPPRYEAQCVVSVDCPPRRAAEVIGAGVAEGINELTGPRYAIRDRAPIVEELLGEAVAGARRKAERLARSAERTLGPVMSVDEGGLGGVEPWGSDLEERIIPLSEPRSGGPGDVELHPARVRIGVSLRVAFALG